jgi:hypothetical protein
VVLRASDAVLATRASVIGWRNANPPPVLDHPGLNSVSRDEVQAVLAAVWGAAATLTMKNGQPFLIREGQG